MIYILSFHRRVHIEALLQLLIFTLPFSGEQIGLYIRASEGFVCLLYVIDD